MPCVLCTAVWLLLCPGTYRTHACVLRVLAQGLYDPWHGGGILSNLSSTILAVILPHGAHHLDLMFSNPADPLDAIAAREAEVGEMKRWVAEANARNGNTLYRHMA